MNGIMGLVASHIPSTTTDNCYSMNLLDAKRAPLRHSNTVIGNKVPRVFETTIVIIISMITLINVRGI
jgi:hypothetical protein